jgi:hypothetical protein
VYKHNVQLDSIVQPEQLRQINSPVQLVHIVQPELFLPERLSNVQLASTVHLVRVVEPKMYAQQVTSVQLERLRLISLHVHLEHIAFWVPQHAQLVRQVIIVQEHQFQWYHFNVHKDIIVRPEHNRNINIDVLVDTIVQVDLFLQFNVTLTTIVRLDLRLKTHVLELELITVLLGRQYVIKKEMY